MKHWDNLIFEKHIRQTEKGHIIFFNIIDNKMSDCDVKVDDTIIYENEKYRVIGIERMSKTFNDTNGNPLPGDNFVFLIKKFSEIMEEEVRELVKKWDAIGLLEGLKPMTELDEMAKLLECEPRQVIERWPNE